MKHLFFKKNISSASAEKRSRERIGTNINASFFQGNLFYSGTVLNLSEKSMFITTKKRLPADSMFVVVFREYDKLMKVIAQVKRNAVNNLHGEGLGIELVSPPAVYAEFVNQLR